jgi:hypothetical protein
MGALQLSEPDFSETKISERVEFLLNVAQDLIERGILPDDKLILHEGRVRLAVESYFLLNKAYKKWRINSGHHTEKPKIAALQATTIARIQPFIPIHHANAESLAEARCNEIFALTYAFAILEKDFNPNTPPKKDLTLRLLDIISASEVEAIEPYILDTNLEIKRKLDEYTLAIPPSDKHKINSLITIFELISAKGDALK